MTYGGDGSAYKGVWWVDPRERDHLEDPDVYGRLSLKWIFQEVGWGIIDWIDLAQDWNSGGFLGTFRFHTRRRYF